MKRKLLVVILYALSVTAASIVALALLASPAVEACIGADGTVPPWGGSGANGVMAAKIAAAWEAAGPGAKYPLVPPVTGTQPAVIILIQNSLALPFPGVTFDYPALANWTTRLTDIDGYYNEVSMGTFGIAAAPETHGTPNDGIIGPLDIGLITAASDIDGTNSEAIAVAAIIAASAFINFGAFDTNIPADGIITPDELHIMIYQAGNETSYDTTCTTPRAWAHNLWRTPGLLVSSPPDVFLQCGTPPKYIIAYSYCGEHFNDGVMATMGQMTHELGHDIGLPDLYDTNTVPTWDGLGYHCLMASGSWGTTGGTVGSSPVHIDGYFKDWLGWGDLIAATTGSNSVTLAAANGSNDVFRVDIPGTSEFFIIENRQQTGYDAGFPNTAGTVGGLAVYHCDWNLLNPALSYFKQNEVNAFLTGTTPGFGMKLEEAHGSPFDLDVLGDGNAGDDNDYFRSGKKTDFDDASDPDSDTKAGAASGVDMSSVSVSGDPMTFTLVAPDQGTEGEGETETDIRFSVDAAAIGVTGSAVNQNSPLPVPSPLMADIYVGWNDTNALNIPLAKLGLQPGDDVDAIDIFDQNSPDMELHLNDAYWHFGVDTATVGSAGVAPDVSSEAFANEAAGDIFWSRGATFGWPLTGGNTREVQESWIGLLDGAPTPPPDEDNKDALDISGPVFPEEGNLPLNAVYFSLTPSSPSLVPLAYSPADILATDGAGGFYRVKEANQIGLIPGDDIDALFMDSTGVFHFSLAPGSPTLGNPVYGGTGSPADIFYWGMSGLVRVITAAQLGLKVDDNVDALDATMTLIEGAEGEGEEGEGEEFEFTTLPIGGWFQVGDRLTLTVGVSGTVGAVTYQWVKDDVGDIDEVEHPSAVTSVFTIDSLVKDDSGGYACRVTDESKADYLTPEVHVEVFDMLPAAGLAALIGAGAMLSVVAAWRIRRKK